MSKPMIELGVNIDHVATLRQARRTWEPDPVWAAVEAHLGGADGITVHLREDRRHIQDADVEKLRQLTQIKLNLEMAATDEMVGIACRLKPEMAMLVPEGRHEVTTEGGLDCVGQESKLKDAIARLADAGIVTSVFIDAELPQIEAAARIGAKVCEIHTGPYAHAFHARGATPRHRRCSPRSTWCAAPGRPSAISTCASMPVTRSTTTTCSRSPALPGRARAAYRPFHRQPLGLRRPARSGARDEGVDARSGTARRVALA